MNREDFAAVVESLSTFTCWANKFLVLKLDSCDVAMLNIHNVGTESKMIKQIS